MSAARKIHRVPKGPDRVYHEAMTPHVEAPVARTHGGRAGWPAEPARCTNTLPGEQAKASCRV